MVAFLAVVWAVTLANLLAEWRGWGVRDWAPQPPLEPPETASLKPPKE